MSRWNHALCDVCFFVCEGDREPVRLKVPERERCCGCGLPTTSGIYYRADPDRFDHCDHH